MRKLLFTLMACFVALAANAVTVYFENTANWGDVYAYAWTPNNASWPGVKVTTTIQASGKTFYAYTIPSNQPNIIFNAGNGKPQTKDLAAVDGAVYNGNNVSSTEKMGTITGSAGNYTYTPSGVVVKEYDWYLVGTVNGWAQRDEKYGFTQSSSNSNIYTLDIEGEFTSGFKLIDINTTWYGSNTKIDVNNNSVNSTITMSTGGGDVAFSNTSKTIKNAHLEFNASTKALTITGNTGTATYDLYLIGEMTSWGTNATYKFQTSDYNTYTLTLESFQNGVPFKVGSEGWTISLTADNLEMKNGTYTLQSGGENNNMALAMLMSNVTFTVNLANNTLTISGTEEGEYVPNYSSWWVNMSGAFNDNNFDNTYTQPNAEGLAVFESVAIGTSTFEIKTWNGTTDSYYNSCADGDLIEGEWMEISNANMEGQFIKIADAKEGQSYKVEFDCTNNNIRVTAPGEVVEPTFPEKIYLMGDVNSYAWSTSEGVEAVGEEGVYNWSKVTVDANADNEEIGYFNFGTVLGTDWNAVNSGNRYGSTVKDKEIESGVALEVKLFAVNVDASSCQSWTAAPGEYDFELDLNTMTLTVTAVEEEPTPDYGEEIEATYTFENLSDAEGYYPSLPPTDEWTTDSGSNKKFALPSGTKFDVKGASLTLNSTSDGNICFYWVSTSGKTDLRVSTGGTLTLSVPNGYSLDKIDFGTGGTNSTINKLALVEGEPGTLVNEPTKHMVWTAPATRAADAITSVTFQVSGTTATRISSINVTASQIPTVVEEVVAEDESNAVYYNLQGVKVANPDKGIYVRVLNGKATKVVK